jgi:H+-transporting ATPase
MADNKDVGAAPALDTTIESGGFDEKRAAETTAPPPKATKEPIADEEEEDEDIDALIEDLESQEGGDVFDEEEETQPGGGRIVPEDMLQTDSRVGLTESEVTTRRRKYGLNQMKEEKENLVLKFLGFFIGPIQFVMEVRDLHFFHFALAFHLICFSRGIVCFTLLGTRLFFPCLSRCYLPS